MDETLKVLLFAGAEQLANSISDLSEKELDLLNRSIHIMHDESVKKVRRSEPMTLYPLFASLGYAIARELSEGAIYIGVLNDDNRKHDDNGD